MTTTQTTDVNTDLHIVKTECWDADVMDVLCSRGHEMGYATKDLRLLQNYKKSRKGPGQNEVVYHYAKGFEKEQLGRLYPRGMEGLQGFPKDIRNPLLQKFYWEIDIENAHYWLSEQLADQWGVQHENLSQYIQHRDEWLGETDENPARAKLGFLKAMYGGTVREYFDIRDDGDVRNPALIKRVETELSALRSKCADKHPAEAKKLFAKAKPNPLASLYALVLQSKERECVLAMDAFFKTKGRSVDVLIHDAVALRKLDGEAYVSELLLRECESYIYEKTGFRVHLVSKGFKHSFKKPEASEELYDDEYAARTFVRLMGDNIAREDDDVYFFNKQTGMWDRNDVAYRTAVSSLKKQLIFRSGDFIYNYGGCEKNVNAMRKWISTALPDTKFISRNADSSFGKLLFADGIYDFYTDSFKEGFDPTIVFNKRIDRPYPRNRDEALIAEVNKVLFEDAFADEDGLKAGEYLRKALCKGLLGDYGIKKFYFGLGESNCGKGVTTMAFTNAFGDYCSQWDGNNLKYNPRNGQDEAKKLAWVKGLIGVRLAFANEMRMDKVPIDGNILKTLSSGGDEMKTRANHENEQKFINRATMFCLANDMLPITPNDSGVRERCRFIRYRLRFVSEPRSADERKGDPAIKTKFQSDAYKNALFHLMVDTFKAMRAEERNRCGQLDTPLCVVEETKEWVGDGGDGDFGEAIRRRYDITGNPEDSVPSRDIVKYIVETCKMRLSDVKIGRELSKMIKNANAECPRDRNPVGEETGKQRLGIKVRENPVE